MGTITLPGAEGWEEQAGWRISFNSNNSGKKWSFLLGAASVITCATSTTLNWGAWAMAGFTGYYTMGGSALLAGLCYLYYNESCKRKAWAASHGQTNQLIGRVGIVGGFGGSYAEWDAKRKENEQKLYRLEFRRPFEWTRLPDPA